MTQEKIKISDVIAQELKNLGITHAFGIIGAGNVHLFESIARLGYTEIICVHHEQSASMAMQTYYRMNKKLAACLLTTGGGSTNGVTGVVSAWADSIPGLIIAGNENSKFTTDSNPLRMWGVQGYDSVDMVRKVTKYSHRVMDATEVIYQMQKSVDICLSDRPGPCWLEVPMNVQSTFVYAEELKKFEKEVEVNSLSAELSEQVGNCVNSLLISKRPVLWFGHGIRLAGAEQKLETLLELSKVPSLVSWAGIDMVESDHPMVFGRAGVYGQRAANFVLQNSDYVLAIGTRLALPQIGYDLRDLARDADIDVVDIDHAEANKHRSRINQSIVCDAGLFIDAMIEKLKKINIGDKSSWITQCNQYREEFPWVDREHDDREGYMNSYRFMKKLNSHFKDNQVVVTDMGTALLCGHQVLNIKKGQRLMTSTGLGEMGYGLPAAIGASFADNKKEVMCLNCDGGMMMNLQELQTIVHHQLPIKIFIFNNDGYLMIKHTQNALFKKGYVGTNKESGVSCPDFSKIGKAFDIPVFQIRTWEECDDVIDQVQSSTGPVICEVFMHPEQLFTPKLGMRMLADGTLVSSPLEDLSPVLPRDQLEKAMIIGMNPKSLG